MSFKHLSEKTFAFMEMESYEELTARLAKALADLEARLDEYQELEKDEAELEAKLAELKAMCHVHGIGKTGARGGLAGRFSTTSSSRRQCWWWGRIWFISHCDLYL